MVLAQVGERSIGLISILILARLLVPADFGLVAMASVIIAFLTLLSAFGFDMALIQNRTAERRHYDTAWTFNVLAGVFTATILLLLSIPASHFFREPRLVAVIMVLALGPLVGGLENIGVVAFRKELTFDREFRFLISKKLAGFFVTVGCAFALRSYWALVAGIVTGRFLGVVLSYLVHPYRPKLSLAAGRELLNFSKWLLLNNFISFFYLRSADFIVGRVAGARALGLYDIAYEISNLPTTELIAPINRAIFPGYAQMSADHTTLRQGFLKVISVVALLALPAATGIAATAELLVKVALGENWADAAPVIQILAFYGAITALETNTYYVHMALGNVRAFTFLMAMSLIILVPLVIFLTLEAGAVGAATAYLLVAILFFPLYYRAVMRRLGVGTWQLITYMWRPVAAVAAMYLILRQVLSYVTLDSVLVNFVQLIGLIALGATSYCVVILGLWHLSGKPSGAERYVLDNIALLIRRQPSSPN
jgi:lipopolysaccharide exporter